MEKSSKRWLRPAILTLLALNKEAWMTAEEIAMKLEVPGGRVQVALRSLAFDRMVKMAIIEETDFKFHIEYSINPDWINPNANRQS